MNTLITGGHGLVGSFINFGLKPSRKELDLFDYESLLDYVEKNNINSLIHCAAKVGGVKANSDNMFDYFFENMLINLNIMRVCKEKKIDKVISVSSTCVFPSNVKLPFNEDTMHDGEPHVSNFGYGYSKRMLEVGFRAMKVQYGTSSCCLIPCNLYGGNDNYDIVNGHVIPSLIHKCYLAKLNNTDFEIWGSGKAEREFLYAKDFAKVIELIHSGDTFIDGSVIISPDDLYKVSEIVDIIVDKFDFKGKVVFDKTKPEGVMRKNTDNKKFKEYFPDFKFTDLKEGLSETINYFVENYSKVRK